MRTSIFALVIIVSSACAATPAPPPDDPPVEPEPAAQCSEEEASLRALLQRYPPIADAPNLNWNELVVTGSATLVFSAQRSDLDVWTTPSPRVSTDGATFEPFWNLSRGEIAVIADVSRDEVWALVEDGDDLHVELRHGLGCPAVMGRLTGASSRDSYLLAVLPDGTLVASLHLLQPDQRVIVTSADRGRTWVTRSSIAGHLLAFAPSQPQRFHLALGPIEGLPSIATSPDLGETWSYASIPSDAGLVGRGIAISLAVDPGDPMHVVAVVDGDFAGLYESADGGRTFPASTRVPVPGTVAKVGFTPDRRMWVAARDGGARGSGGLFGREAGGTALIPLNSGLSGSEIPATGFGFSEGTLWRLGDVIRKSVDGGKSWSAVPTAGLGTPSFLSDMTDPKDENVFVASSGSRAALEWVRTNDGGRSFLRLPIPSPREVAALTQTGDGVLLAYYLQNQKAAGGKRSLDGGQTWTDMAGLTPSTFDGWSTFWGPVHQRGSRAYINNQFELWRTDDNGANWRMVADLSRSIGGLKYGAYVAVDRSTDGRLFVSQQGPDRSLKLSVSTDAGDTMTEVAIPAGVRLDYFSPPVVDLDGRLWVIASSTSAVPGLFTIEPGTAVLSAKTYPAGERLETPRLLGRLARIGQSKSRDGGRTWEKLDPAHPAWEDIATDAGGVATRANPERVFSPFFGSTRSGLLGR